MNVILFYLKLSFRESSIVNRESGIIKPNLKSSRVISQEYKRLTIENLLITPVRPSHPGGHN